MTQLYTTLLKVAIAYIHYYISRTRNKAETVYDSSTTNWAGWNNCEFITSSRCTIEICHHEPRALSPSVLLTRNGVFYSPFQFLLRT